MTWLMNDEEFEPELEFLEDYVGFVYCITEVETDKKYIGKKLFWKPKTLPITKTRKRRIKTRVESDWKSYHGSSDTVKMLLKEGGQFRREILRLCKTKGECSYFEAREQFLRDVLIRDDYYNGIINCRINRKHLKL